MQITLHTEPDQATYHDAAFEPCRSEIRQLLEECRTMFPEAAKSLDDDQACGKVIAKIEDQLIACGLIHTDDEGVCEINNFFTKDYEEHIEVSRKLLQLIIKKARKNGCRMLRHSLHCDWNVTASVLKDLGFIAVNSDSSDSSTFLTMELSLES